jgi:hypothetical protein
MGRLNDEQLARLLSSLSACSRLSPVFDRNLKRALKLFTGRTTTTTTETTLSWHLAAAHTLKSVSRGRPYWTLEGPGLRAGEGVGFGFFACGGFARFAAGARPSCTCAVGGGVSR